MKKPNGIHRPPLCATRGSAMIVSVAILSVMMLGFALFGTYVSMERNRSGEGMEQKYVAKETASSCMEKALLKLVQNPSYQGNEDLILNGASCIIRPIYKTNGQWVIEVQAQVELQTQRFVAVVSSLDPVTLVSWVEVGSF